MSFEEYANLIDVICAKICLFVLRRDLKVSRDGDYWISIGRESPIHSTINAIIVNKLSACLRLIELDLLIGLVRPFRNTIFEDVHKVVRSLTID